MATKEKGQYTNGANAGVYRAEDANVVQPEERGIPKSGQLHRGLKPRHVTVG